MSISIHTHRSTAYVKPITQRGPAWKPDPITNQFRFVVRMAVACHERDVPYVLTWGLANGIMSATITATGDIPMPKPLAKPSKVKPFITGNHPYSMPRTGSMRIMMRVSSADVRGL